MVVGSESHNASLVQAKRDLKKEKIRSPNDAWKDYLNPQLPTPRANILTHVGLWPMAITLKFLRNNLLKVSNSQTWFSLKVVSKKKKRKKEKEKKEHFLFLPFPTLNVCKFKGEQRLDWTFKTSTKVALSEF